MKAVEGGWKAGSELWLLVANPVGAVAMTLLVREGGHCSPDCHCLPGQLFPASGGRGTSYPRLQDIGGGVWHRALVLVCWRRLLASRHCVWVLSPEDPPSRCVGPPCLFPHGGGSWRQHIKNPNGINLQLCAQH